MTRRLRAVASFFVIALCHLAESIRRITRALRHPVVAIHGLAIRWRAASPVTRYVLPLVLLCLVVGIDWLRLHVNGVATREEARHLFFRLGIVAGLAAAVMIAGARRWRVQGLGLLTFLIGCCGLFVRFLGGWGPQPVAEWERDAYQASLDVGGILLFVGLLLWLLARWIRHEGTDAPSEELMGTSTNVVYDRRSPDDRRRGWGKLPGGGPS